MVVSNRNHDLIHASVTEENGEFLLSLLCLHNVVIMRRIISTLIIHEIATIVDVHGSVQLSREIAIRCHSTSQLV